MPRLYKGLIIAALMLAVSGCAFAAFAAEEMHAITFDDLISLGRIGDFEVSPDGERIAMEVTWFNKEANSSNSDIYLLNLKNDKLWDFVRNEADDYAPAWAPDGKSIYFVSTRSGRAEIWNIPINGGEAKRISDVPTGTSQPLVSPDGRYIAFTSRVYPGCKDMSCNGKKLDEFKSGKVKARLIDHLMYRHWNRWREGRWSHLFISDTNGKILAELNQGRTDVPPIALGGERDYDFSPDSKEICFTMNPDPVVAVSTNNDLFIASLPDGKPVDITAENHSNDNNPRYSPNGRYIAYRAQFTPGFESDKYRLVLYDRKSHKKKVLTEKFDYSIEDFVWAPDSKTLYFNTEDRGRISIGKVTVKGNDARLIITGGYDAALRITPDGKSLILARQSVTHPTDLYKASTRGARIVQLTDINKEVLSSIKMNPVQEFWYYGADSTRVEGMLVKPPFFTEGKKYPVILLIHGGPQGAFGDEFHYRWNAQMFASPGYVVVMLNPRGSTGYGQKFTSEISGDWGGKCYRDIMKGIDYVYSNYNGFIDTTRVAAAGASFGGYMIDWLEGHTDRFRCMVSHAGVYDLTSMYGATEELWFPEWEFKGTPWTNPESYTRWSPSEYAANFKTPCLVVQGEMDFRVPYNQGLEFFTALQRQGVPSKLLFFPDEYHFVVKPLNAELWWKTLHEWFAEYLK